MLSFSVGIGFQFLPKFWLLAIKSLLIASLVTLIADGEVLLLCTAIKASANLCNRLGVRYPLASFYCLWPELKSCQFILTGTIWGLWITGFANYSPDLGDNPA